MFDNEEFSGKLNGFRALWKTRHPEHRHRSTQGKAAPDDAGAARSFKRMRRQT
jgi:hypothetical protein